MARSSGSDLELLLLALLTEPAHGYALVEALKDRSGGAIEVPEGSVYPALYRLERSGFVSSADVEVQNRRRRVYRLTAKGRAERLARIGAWERETATIRQMLGGGPLGAETR